VRTFFRAAAGGSKGQRDILVHKSLPLRDRRAVIASTIGTTIEWYDFLLYGQVTGLVFAKLYFPSSDPLTGVLQAFAVYAAIYRIGRKRMSFIGAVGTGIFAFIYFALFNTTVPGWIVLASVLAFFVPDLMYGPQAALIAECFTPRPRYSGGSLGYQLASVFAGEPAPPVATALFAAPGSAYAIAVYFLAQRDHQRRRRRPAARPYQLRHLRGTPEGVTLAGRPTLSRPIAENRVE